MAGLEELIAASHSKMSAGRKAKIVSRVKAHVPKEHAKKAQQTADHVLSKDKAADKSDDALIAEIKAALKGNFMVTSGIDNLITAVQPEEQIYTLTVRDRDGALWKILDYIKHCGDIGHSIDFKIDDKHFGFDGDGGDKIVTMDRDETASLEAASTPKLSKKGQQTQEILHRSMRDRFRQGRMSKEDKLNYGRNLLAKAYGLKDHEHKILYHDVEHFVQTWSRKLG